MGASCRILLKGLVVSRVQPEVQELEFILYGFEFLFVFVFLFLLQCVHAQLLLDQL